MESPDKNPFPEIKIFRTARDYIDILRGAAHYLFDHIRSEGLSDHANHGAAAELDRQLYDETIPDLQGRDL